MLNPGDRFGDCKVEKQTEKNVMFGVLKRKWRVASLAVSETGAVRKDNQDAFFVDAAKTLFCVADGMGGGSEGATASRFVCEEIAKVAEIPDFAARMKAVDSAIGAANARIRAYSQEKGFKQMGTTVAVLLVNPADARKGVICHVGDSRIYRVRGGAAELLTKDHTIGGQLSEFATGDAAAGLRNRRNPLAHVLTRAIGVEEKVAGDWRKLDIEKNDRYLVCSDGVHDVIADSQIGDILTVSQDIEEASKRLSDEIVRNGAPDNYTYVMIKIGDGK